MPRAGNTYELPAGSTFSPGTTIESAKVNAALQDLADDNNAARPITAGGSASQTAVGAADNFSPVATVASATTTDIGAASGISVTISGTTTITGFGTKTAGVRRYLTFSGALILTHHATSLILPGAANITTVAGDCAVALSLGSGNWRVVDYTRAADGPGRPLAATDTVMGSVEKATAAEVWSATTDKFISADLIETASAGVTLTDAATIALDCDAFYHGEVTISANRVLGNPTNGQPGTYRTVQVKGSSGTERELTFGNQYFGTLPELNDITSTKWYLLTIRCMTTTRFLVSGQVSS